MNGMCVCCSSNLITKLLMCKHLSKNVRLFDSTFALCPDKIPRSNFKKNNC